MFGHVTWTKIYEPLWKNRLIEALSRRLRGRPENTWEENVEKDQWETGAVDEDALDRDERRVIMDRVIYWRRDKKALTG